MKKILVCEDEDSIRDFVVINLKRSGYEVYDVASGEEALEVFKQNKGDFDIALLDVMMPGIDGFEVCKKLREMSETIGIIMLTAKTQEMDRVRGLMLGADDYISKPFSPSELVARVDAIYRRVSMLGKNPQHSETIRSGPFEFNPKSRILSKNNSTIPLTQVEYQIMELFLKNPNVALERGRVLKTVWGDENEAEEKIVDVNIRRLRMKIEDNPSQPEYILTIWGYGYKWNETK